MCTASTRGRFNGFLVAQTVETVFHLTMRFAHLAEARRE